MDRLKCVYCRLVVISPVLLPCGSNMCKHHILQTFPEGFIKCGKCERYHEITKLYNEEHARIIADKIPENKLEEKKKEAKQVRDDFESFIKRVELVLADPLFETYEEIQEMKNEVFLKREELKLKIDQETDKLIDKLDDCFEKLKKNLNDEDFINRSNNLEERKQTSINRLENYRSEFDPLNNDEMFWRDLFIEIEIEMDMLRLYLEKMKNHLVSQKDLDELKSEVKIFNNWNFNIQHTNVFM